MQQPFRKAHRDIWRALPLVLIAAVFGAIALRQNRLAAPVPERIDAPSASGQGVPR